jgi:hypothetical protein
VIGVGFSFNYTSLLSLPGWNEHAWGYHGDNGKIYNSKGTGDTYADCFTTGDVIGCGVDFSRSTAYFTKNGVFLGICVLHTIITSLLLLYLLEGHLLTMEAYRRRFHRSVRAVISTSRPEKSRCSGQSEFWRESIHIHGVRSQLRAYH